MQYLSDTSPGETCFSLSLPPSLPLSLSIFLSLLSLCLCLFSVSFALSLSLSHTHTLTITYTRHLTPSLRHTYPHHSEGMHWFPRPGDTCTYLEVCLSPHSQTSVLPGTWNQMALQTEDSEDIPPPALPSRVFPHQGTDSRICTTSPWCWGHLHLQKRTHPESQVICILCHH